MNPEITSTTNGDFEVRDGNTEKSNTVTKPINRGSSLVYRAILNGKFDEIESLLKLGNPVNVPLRTTGPLAGYTLLHIACVIYTKDVVKLLIEDYHADINVVAGDGAQPIHLAYLRRNSEAARHLLVAGANADAEIGRDLFSKYKHNKVWCEDFGDKMTLSTFAIVYDEGSCIARALIDNNLNFDTRTPIMNNKTLLMYALENDTYVNKVVIKKFKDLELINFRDNDGFLATHYLLHPKKYGGFRYDGKYIIGAAELKKCLIIDCLIENGADIYATINGDPDTLLLNMAAYRSSAMVLRELLPHYNYITKSKALYLSTLPLGDLQTSLRLDQTYNVGEQWGMLHEQRRLCTELILKDLVNRRTFGLPVPEEEKQLMDKLIRTDTIIRAIVHNYEVNFIKGILHNKTIQYGDKSITFYDFILKSSSDATFRLLVKNRILMEAFSKFFSGISFGYDCYYFFRLLQRRIDVAVKRVHLLQKLKKIKQLREVIPLPYELILDIIEYLGNQDLEKFIDASFNI